VNRRPTNAPAGSGAHASAAAGAARSLQHEIGKRRPFESAEQEAYLNLLRTASVLSGPFDALFRAHGLSEATYNALRILRGARGAAGGGGAGKGDGGGEQARAMDCDAAAAGGAGAAGVRTCREVGEHLVARVPDVTRLIDRLESQGYARRERCEHDRRVVNVAITDRGLDVLARLDGPLLELHRRQLGHMPRAELAELSRLLARAREVALASETAEPARDAEEPTARARPASARRGRSKGA
jgi:DNA-binding MarR family transcriptional regulator